MCLFGWVISLHIHTRIDFIRNHLFTKNLRNKDKRYPEKKNPLGKKKFTTLFLLFFIIEGINMKTGSFFLCSSARTLFCTWTNYCLFATLPSQLKSAWSGSLSLHFAMLLSAWWPKGHQPLRILQISGTCQVVRRSSMSRLAHPELPQNSASLPAKSTLGINFLSYCSMLTGQVPAHFWNAKELASVTSVTAWPWGAIHID